MPEQLVNNALSYLNANINAAVTTLDVVDGTVFPSSGNFSIRINNEILKVTARSGNTLTVERATEGTTAASHLKADPVAAIFTKRVLEDYLGDNIVQTTWAARGAATRRGQIWYQTDGPYVAIADGSAWVNRLVNSLVEPPTWFGSGSWVNQGTATLTTSKGFYRLVTPTGNVRAFVKSVPAAPYTLIVAFDCLVSTGEAGICLRGAGGNIITYGASVTGEILAKKWDNENSFNSSYSPDLYNGLRPRTWLKLEDDNTDRILSISIAGADFQPMLTVGRTDFLTPTQIGFFVNGRGILNVYHWDE